MKLNEILMEIYKYPSGNVGEASHHNLIFFQAIFLDTTNVPIHGNNLGSTCVSKNKKNVSRKNLKLSLGYTLLLLSVIVMAIWINMIFHMLMKNKFPAVTW